MPDFAKEYLLHKEYVRRDMFKEHPDVFYATRQLILLHNYSVQADTDPLNKYKLENFGFVFGKLGNIGRKSQSPFEFLCKMDNIRNKILNKF